MKIIKWEQLPPEMQTEKVREYYDILEKKSMILTLKRIFDLVVSLVLLAALIPVFVVLAIAIKLDSRGPVFYCQERVTQYGKRFKIHKFRTMVQGADKGAHVTSENDARVTRVGKLIRNFRLDELPQLIDVIAGNMTFVGVRPESPKYVAAYTDEMMATLLLPAGITNLTSIYYKEEAKLLDGVEDTDRVYVEEILPVKMYYNLKGLKQVCLLGDIKIMFMTVLAVLGKEYKGDCTDFATLAEKGKYSEETRI